MAMNRGPGRHTLSKAESTAVAAAVNAILFRCQLQRGEGRMRAAIHAWWKRTLQSTNVEGEDSGAICDAVLQVCSAMGCGTFPRATPRWWMKRRTGGTWEDLRQCDDMTVDYFKDKLRMSPRMFREITKALSPFLEHVTFYREPLQPDHIVAYALYMWASGETYESGTCNLGIGRSSGLVAMRDVTARYTKVGGGGRCFPCWKGVMEGCDGDGPAVLSTTEKTAVVVAAFAVVRRFQVESAAGRMKAALSRRRQRLLLQRVLDAPDCVTTSEAMVQLCAAIGCGLLPRATPLWWMRRRAGGTWEDLRVYDDATDDYFRKKLRMSRRLFMEISEACSPHVQRQVTFYREPLQPDQIVVYALYRWATGESYENSTSSFGMGRTSGVRAVRDVTAAMLRVYGDKISRPTGVRKHVVLWVFLENGFPNCHGAVDCTHIYVDKPANTPSENYFDRKHRFSVIAQVVVGLDLRVLDVFVG
ncbi:hypothetical protein CBR_g51817 [Chara braunii]|uniref:DDE Tnp4 domain-containing protein n=1 Tax=Chara braunii TaxID=69332 RepID=A0A388M9C8_CHABU|nr:hypothetical protein CBR_g51817 [Chara braunii]|eukprot:GBG91083.1 hypothetical protein CBR_g51817 [Chara braunii]